MKAAEFAEVHMAGLSTYRALMIPRQSRGFALSITWPDGPLVMERKDSISIPITLEELSMLPTQEDN